jgi:hypothetical protein
MDWLSPVNAGAPSALVLKEGDRVFCRSCDTRLWAMARTPRDGDEHWQHSFAFEHRDHPRYAECGHLIFPIKCHKCDEPVLVYSDAPDAPLELRPKD